MFTMHWWLQLLFVHLSYHFTYFHLNNGGWIVGNELKAQWLAVQRDIGCLGGVLVSTFPAEWEVIPRPGGAFVSPSSPSASLNISTDAHQFPTPARLSSDVGLRHQRRKHKHGPDPWSLSQWDSPCNKIWWTVSNFLPRRAKCNHSARCSDAGSPVVLYCTYLVCARSGNPTKWLRCVTARDTGPSHKHGHMTAWKQLWGIP